MSLWMWRDLCAEIPDDWEMLQFSRNRKVGRCSFADRYQFRLEINWRVVEGTPDFERMLSDYRSKLMNDENMEDVQQTNVVGWEGLEGYIKGDLSSRFGKFFPGQSCIVEVVFLWPEKSDVWLMRNVLSGLREVNGDSSDLRRWRAFGMDLLAGRELDLKECRAEPANATMFFSDDKSGCTESFGRRGMIDVWLAGTVKQWLRDQLPEGLKPDTEKSSELKGHVIEYFGGQKRAPRIPGLLGRKLRCDASAWICPRDNRLYSTVLVHRRSSDAGGREEGRLRCCSDMEMETC